MATSAPSLPLDPPRRLSLALGYGLLCHLSFALGVGLMFVGLHEGLRLSWGPLRGAPAWALNALLLLQFPFLHSWLLGRRGGGLLARLAPAGLGRPLATTIFATLASWQLILVFGAWSPSGIVWWEAQGALRRVLQALFLLSWLALLKSMSDAGLGVQTGSLGWLSLARGRAPEYGSFPQEGSFRVCRQPIYLAFALTLWTGPVWTPDRLVLALGWTAYCVLGPRAKEARYLRRYGEAFREYQARTPYMIPSPFSRRS